MNVGTYLIRTMTAIKKAADLATGGLGGIQRFRWVGRSGGNVQGATKSYGTQTEALQGLNCGDNVICSSSVCIGWIYMRCAVGADGGFRSGGVIRLEKRRRVANFRRIIEQGEIS